MEDRVLKLEAENAALRAELDQVKAELHELKNPYVEPYQYRCCKCNKRCGYDGYCGRCSDQY